MKNNVFRFTTFMFVVFLMVSCKKNTKEAKTKDAETTSEAKTTSAKYKLNLAESTIEWKGFKPTGSHFGIINLESGVFSVNNNAVDSGTFLIDMKTIKESENSEKLETHLKSPDFFDIEQYPNAIFDVTGFESIDGKSMLSGNLTLKDAKNNVTFPVTIQEEGNTLTLTSEVFKIDRSKWNVKYGSKSFFDNLGDKFINDNIELKVIIKATKA